MPKLSVEKRIILYLSNYLSLEDSWQVPIDIAQEGISNKLNILQNNVSRSIASLKNDGIVNEKLTYIKGGKRRRKTYFLTDIGKDLVNNIQDELNNEVIKYISGNNEIMEIKSGKFISYIEKEFNKKITIQQIFEYLNNNEILNIDEFLKFKIIDTIEKKSKLINYTEKAPQLYHFYGRENEIKKIKECIDRKEYGIVIIHGIAGIGKTTLALKLIEEYKENKNIFWYRFHEWDSIKNITISLADFLSKQGKNKLKSKITKKQIDINEIGNLLETELENCILFFDDFQKAHNDILNLFSLLVGAGERNKSFKIILLTRESRVFYDIRDVVVKKIIKEIKLDSLSKNASKNLLNKKMDDINFEKIYNLSKGVPLFLELLSSTKESGISNINIFLEKEIFSKFSGIELKILGLLSIFRGPVPSKAILISDEIRYDDITSLVNRLIISQLPFNNFEIHDIIKSFVTSRLSNEKIKQYHKTAAEYYVKKSIENTEPSDAFETIYHLQKCEEWEDTIDFSIKVIPYLIAERYPELENIFSNAIIENISKEKKTDFYIIKGDIAYSNEKWELASGFYKNALQLSQESKIDNQKIAEIHGKYGRAQMNIKKWEETLNSHIEALKIYQKMGNKKGIARKYLDLGMVYKNKNDYDKAHDSYNKSLEIFKSIDNQKGLSVVHNNLALLFISKSDFKKAKIHFEKSLRISEKEKDFLGKAITFFNIGEMEFNRGRLEDAIIGFNKCENLYKKAKKRKDEIICIIKTADVYIENRDYKNAIVYYLNAQKKLEELQKRRKKIIFKPHEKVDFQAFIELYDKIAHSYEMNGELSKALEYYEKLIKIIEKGSSFKDLAKKYLETGLICEKLNNHDKSIFYMEKSLDILTELNEIKGLIAVHINLSRVYKKCSKKLKAQDSLVKALKFAKIEGDEDLINFLNNELKNL